MKKRGLQFASKRALVSFIYIATADLIPHLHSHTTLSSTLRQLVLILAGVATIAYFRFGH